MTSDETSNAPPLTPRHAFVVHFRSDADVERAIKSGRVEHVLSGQAAHFDSVEELLRFVEGTLRELVTCGPLGSVQTERRSR